jgi:hypothetical protein
MDKLIYYRVTGGEPHAFCKDWLERWRARGAELMAWAEAHGAKGWVPGVGSDAIGGWAINGLIFENDTPPDAKLWKARKRRSADGYVIYAPAKRSAEGKALNKEMEALEGLPSMNEFCDRFAFPHSLHYRKSEQVYGVCALRPFFFTTVHIGWIGDEFWIAAPDADAEAAEYVADGYTVEPMGWTAPDGMEPLTRAHYDLAIAQHEVAKLEKAA